MMTLGLSGSIKQLAKGIAQEYVTIAAVKAVELKEKPRQ